MANIFLSQALQAAGKPIVSALAQKSYEQQKFKQMQNALLAEFQELEARELNLLATQKRMENASEQLPENLNKLNALVEMSATGQVDPNTVGKAAAELALANKNLGTTKNALSAELQDIQRKKQFLQTQPVLRAIMSGDVKTEAGLAGISAVQYPVEKPKEEKWKTQIVGGRVGDKDVTRFYIVDEMSGRRLLVDELVGISPDDVKNFGEMGESKLKLFTDYYKITQSDLDRVIGPAVDREEDTLRRKLTADKIDEGTIDTRIEEFRKNALEVGANLHTLQSLQAAATKALMASASGGTFDGKTDAEWKREAEKLKEEYLEKLKETREKYYNMGKERKEKLATDLTEAINNEK